MAVKINKGKALGFLNIMPLLDVVFLLLIFFLVATRFAQEDRELEVSLPDASEATPISVQPKEIFVNIDVDGQFYIGGRFLDANEVEEILAEAVKNNPANQSVIIRADENVKHRYVAMIVNLCKKTGVAICSFATDGEGT